MKLEELKKKIVKENINTKVIRAIIDEKLIINNATGCYRDEEGIWYIYSVSERGNLRIVESGDEDSIISRFYGLIVSLNEDYNEYGDVWS